MPAVGRFNPVSGPNSSAPPSDVTEFLLYTHILFLNIFLICFTIIQDMIIIMFVVVFYPPEDV